jgi:hypothetical protein
MSTLPYDVVPCQYYPEQELRNIFGISARGLPLVNAYQLRLAEYMPLNSLKQLSFGRARS